MNLVPFGKYRGRLVEEMLADQDYIDWCQTQPGLLEKLMRGRVASVTAIQALKVDFVPEDSTPAHNLLQALFLQHEFRQAFFVATFGRSSVELGTQNALRRKRSFENTLKAHLETLRKDTSTHWAKRRDALIRSIESYAMTWEERVPSDTAEFEKFSHDVLLHFTFEVPDYYLGGTQWVPDWPPQEDVIDLRMVIPVEIKPHLGDDYPAVLRQMRRQRETAERQIDDYQTQRTWEKSVLFVGQFAATNVSLEGVRAIFREFSVVTLADVLAVGYRP